MMNVENVVHVQRGPRLCLNSIVKNEEKNLRRMLPSVAPFVTHYAILDTGSTDGTIDFIHLWAEENGIVGTVGRSEFRDYSQARNEALDLAADLFDRETEPDRFDHVLLVDADMELVVQGGVRFPDVAAGVGQEMMQRCGTLDYDNVRLLSAAALRVSRYREYTHEYLATPVPPAARLPGAFFIDHATGSNRTTKFERDTVLLKRALKDDPSNGRAHFYLAETLRNLGRYTDAIGHYKRRIDLAGWDEEVWMARYQLAVSYLAAGLERLGIAAALEAYDARPTRTEPLMLLAKWLREHGRNASAAMIATECLHRDLSQDKLFVETEAYRYTPKSELSISGFYSPKTETKDRARRLALELSIAPLAPEDVRRGARSNLQHYARSLFESVYDAVEPPIAGYTVAILARARDDGWVAMNPSIFRAPDGRLLCIVRRVNYTVANDGSYHVGGKPFRWIEKEGPDGTKVLDAEKSDRILTENELYEIVPVVNSTHSPAGFSAGYLGVLKDETGRETTDFYVQGFEDLRGFVVGGQVHATATVRDDPAGDLPRIALLTIDVEKLAITRSVLLAAPPGEGGKCQKNWVPTSSRMGELEIVYQADPMISLAVDVETGSSTARFEVTPPYAKPFNLDHLRGGSQRVSFGTNGESIYVTHEAIERAGQRRVYLHRFVVLDGNCHASAVSDPFYLDHVGIEFCAGLAWLGDSLVMSYGSNDAEARLCVVNHHAVRRFLEASVKP